MKTLFKFFLLFSLIITSQSALAQNNPDKIVETFFDNYVNAGASEALNQLYASNKWMSRATDAINSLKSKLEGLNEDFVGPFYGYELIVEKKLSQSFILRSYLVKYDRQPIRFTFQFYKPDNKWVVHSFQYDGNVGDEIEEAAKLYYLDLD
ncbi:hypothetical protein [Jiulongibacter sediminis]|jgi:hypothetical protein|uniref:hypothetical protein n=1 Tax=Jiulongibacter sediminis TaxID=1605367 RepID=UPI0026EBA452|nr:hypothetical protein [Jiulongibacter sediminis]